MRKTLYIHPSLARRGPARLRLLREEGQEGGATQGASGDNAGGAAGNSQGSAQSGESGTNNAGTSFDPEAFWNGPAPEGNGAPSGESASGNSGESGNQNQQPNVAQQIADQIGGLQFGDVLTPEVTEQINNGDFSGFQKNFAGAGQQIVRQALAMQVQILRPFAEQLMEQMRGEIESRLTNRDDTDTLVKDFPAASNPAVAQTIRPIFDQALKNTKGNRQLAVKQTKEMMKFLATGTAGDLGLDIAPAGTDPRPQQTQTTNWLDTLTGRN